MVTCTCSVNNSEGIVFLFVLFVLAFSNHSN